MRLLSMFFYVTKDISYKSKNGTSSQAFIHSPCPSIYLIDFIHLSTLSIYLSYPPIHLSIYRNHTLYLSLLFLLNTWFVYCIFLLMDCNTRLVLTMVNLSFILDIYLWWYGGWLVNISFQFFFIIVSAYYMACVC